MEPAPKRQWGARELKIDVHWWKTLAAEFLTNSVGADRAIVLYQAKPHRHRMFAEHLASEDPQIVIGKSGNRVIEWKQNPGKPNNDFWDCLVGCACLASLAGVNMLHAPDATTPKSPKRKPIGKAQKLGKTNQIR
jgi:hypothetical protein